jgi:hypothetical protein
MSKINGLEHLLPTKILIILIILQKHTDKNIKFLFLTLFFY